MSVIKHNIFSLKMLIIVSRVNVRVQCVELTLHFSALVCGLEHAMTVQPCKGEVDCHHNRRGSLCYLCVFLYATCVHMVVSYPICILGMKLESFERVECVFKL